MKKRIFMVLMVLSLAAVACSIGSFGGDGAENTPDGVDQANVIYSEDFSSTSSGWSEGSDDFSSSTYEDGQYRVLVTSEQYYSWYFVDEGGADVRLEVDTQTVTDKGGDIGFICRRQDDENFYILRITSDGMYGIAKMINNEEITLGSGELEVSDAINTGAASNHLRADCVGNTFSLYANDQLLDQVTDDTISADGSVGLIVGTYDEGGQEVLFDNFMVIEP